MDGEILERSGMGQVVSDKMTKRSLAVATLVRHPIYGKIIAEPPSLKLTIASEAREGDADRDYGDKALVERQTLARIEIF